MRTTEDGSFPEPVTPRIIRVVRSTRDLLLFWIWIYVLNDKIQKGPEPVIISAGGKGGWLSATAGRTLHEESMSEAKDSRANGNGN